MSKLLADVSANERPCNSGSRSMRNAREFVDLQTSREGIAEKSSGNWRSKFKNVSGSQLHLHPLRGKRRDGKDPRRMPCTERAAGYLGRMQDSVPAPLRVAIVV